MRSPSETLVLTVVHVGGMTTKAVIDVDEYGKVIKHFTEEMPDTPFNNYRYLGTSADGLPYRLMLGAETLAVSVARGEQRPSSEAIYTLTVKHVNGGTAEMVVTKSEYEKLLAFIEDIKGASSREYLGIDAAGYTYRLMVGNETFSLALSDPPSAEWPSSRK